jgi:hypothetical protein
LDLLLEDVVGRLSHFSFTERDYVESGFGAGFCRKTPRQAFWSMNVCHPGCEG